MSDETFKPFRLHHGLIVATCELVDVQTTDNYPTPDRFGDFAPGRYVWILKNIKECHPKIPIKGRQRLFNVEVSYP